MRDSIYRVLIVCGPGVVATGMAPSSDSSAAGLLGAQATVPTCIDTRPFCPGPYPCGLLTWASCGVGPGPGSAKVCTPYTAPDTINEKGCPSYCDTVAPARCL
jgi:hypothetical protein